MAMPKVFPSAALALADISDGAVLMLGGFGICGIPEESVQALVDKKIKNLTCISNNGGDDQVGIGLLLENKQVKKMIVSYVGENEEFEREILQGEIEFELIPQGTLAERIRCGGAGIPAFFTPAGVGTEVAMGKETRLFDGKTYLMEIALQADFALVKAWKGDPDGNLIYRGTARNFNPLMATAGKITIAEVEELVPLGALDPNEIHTPGIYVQRIFEVKPTRAKDQLAFQRINEKEDPVKEVFQGINPIPRKSSESQKLNLLIPPEDPIKNLIAARIAQEIKEGDYVNLGIGIPTLVANFIPVEKHVILQSENGLLGIGPYPLEGQEDLDLVNAGKHPITMIPGASLFDSATSFAMIRGKHVDLTVLGAMQVSAQGDIANWKIPNRLVKGMGGAMDLVASAKNIIVAMQHCSKDGRSKLVSSCNLPLTGIACVKKIVTELGVFDILPGGGFCLVELMPGVTVQEVRNKTDAPIVLGKNIIQNDE
jgi:3-oxoacid CoA-transferase